LFSSTKRHATKWNNVFEINVDSVLLFDLQSLFFRFIDRYLLPQNIDFCFKLLLLFRVMLAISTARHCTRLLLRFFHTTNPPNNQ